jgi:hypothetical protein
MNISQSGPFQANREYNKKIPQTPSLLRYIQRESQYNRQSLLAITFSQRVLEME